MGYLYFFVVLGVLVFFHELGHYLAARWSGVSIESFSVGFGPELLGYTDSAQTRWKICMFPLGGYVKMKGDLLPDSSEEECENVDQSSFIAQPLLTRFIVVFAGPLANFILAIFLFLSVYFFFGIKEPIPVIAQVFPGSAAASSGLLTGDRIQSINGHKIEKFQDILLFLRDSDPLRLEVLREGHLKNVSVSPQNCNAQGRDFCLGIIPEEAQRSVNFPQSVHYAVVSVFSLTVDIVHYLLHPTKMSLKDLGGPIKIAKMSKLAGERGIESLFFFMSILSINLGIMNLLPLPVLDGGYLLFFVCEAIFGKNFLSTKFKIWSLKIGFALLILLSIFVLLNDLNVF